MRLRAESGSAAVELVLITPVLLLLLLFGLAAGRFSVARNQVVEAARDAAREASIWSSPAQASQAGVQRGIDSLGASRVSCQAPEVSVDTSELRPGGRVVVDVTCTVGLGDVLGLQMGGSRRLRARSVAVVDAFRSTR